MKRTLAIAFVLALLTLCLAGCGETKDEKKDDVTNGTTDTDGGLYPDSALGPDGTILGEDPVADADGERSIDHKNGNLYGKAYLTPETERSANAQLRSNGRSLTGIPNDELYGDRYRQMLANGRVHDSDGFLRDGENASYNTLR